MPSIERQLRAIEREINALSANQAPNPADIGTFVHSLEVPADPNLLTIVGAAFENGVKAFRVFITDPSVNFFTVDMYDTEAIFFVGAPDGAVITVVALADFVLDYR